MEEVDIQKTINRVFEILEEQIKKKGSREAAIQDAKRAIIEITFRSYTDTSEITKALLPKHSIFL